MSQQQTLTSVFEATKEELANSLSGLLLPKDAERVLNVIVDYFSKVCDDNSDYRQNLTQSEDYILQAALSMLNAQRALVAAFDCKPEITIVEERKTTTSPRPSHAPVLPAPSSSLIGAGGGAVVGKLIWENWGAVFGAIAGTALTIYLSQRTRLAKALITPQVAPKTKVVVKDIPVDTPALLAVIGQICDSLDNLVETFRAQIKRVVNKYESQEKPTIEREYRVLLEGIQSLIGYKRGHSPEEEKYLSKLQTRVEDLAELLDNYGLEAVDYTPDHSDWFEAIESKNTTEPQFVAPAIIKNGGLVIKGKIFIPKK